MPMYPLKFHPSYKEKVWGGRSLESLGRNLPAGKLIGESWELADLARTSASGGGGAAERSVIANGPLAGRTLHDVMDETGAELLGRLPLSAEGGFPLLVKYLDAQQNLSVQVHPSPEYAAAHEDAYLKSEAWYIVDANMGAVIYKGVHEGVTPEQFRQAVENNTVEELLIKVPVRPGDMHYLPSGTCHALGAGILVAEVQTPSDTTYRVYDWGRQGRDLHLDQALQCIHFGPADTAANEPDTTIERDTTTVTTLVKCDYFRVERLAIHPGTDLPMPHDQPVVWMVIEGAGRVTCQGGGLDDQPFDRGETLLIPASVESLQLHTERQTTLLEISFPQTMDDLLA
jgi:mannose-6-phosphate isomerase